MPNQTMPKTIRRGFVTALALAALAAGPTGRGVFGAEPFYLGTWKITSAVVAPWWEDRVHKPDPAESKSLLGRAVTFEAKRIMGPPLPVSPENVYTVFSSPSLIQEAGGLR